MDLEAPLCHILDMVVEVIEWWHPLKKKKQPECIKQFKNYIISEDLNVGGGALSNTWVFKTSLFFSLKCFSLSLNISIQFFQREGTSEPKFEM